MAKATIATGDKKGQQLIGSKKQQSAGDSKNAAVSGGNKCSNNQPFTIAQYCLLAVTTGQLPFEF